MTITPKEIKLEIAGLEIAKKHLVRAAAAIEKRCAKDREKWQERQKLLAGYESYEDAQEAYGYGDITSDELYAIGNKLEQAEPETKYTIAKKVLMDYLIRVSREILDHQWELLSDTDKDRINAQRDALAAKIKERRTTNEEV